LTLLYAPIDPVEGIIAGLLPLLAFHPLSRCCLFDPLPRRCPINLNATLLRLFLRPMDGCRLAAVDPPLLPGFRGYSIPLLPVPLNPGSYRPVVLDSGSLLPVALGNCSSLAIRFDPPPSLRTSIDSLASLRTGIDSLASLRTGIDSLASLRTSIDSLAIHPLLYLAITVDAAPVAIQLLPLRKPPGVTAVLNRTGGLAIFSSGTVIAVGDPPSMHGGVLPATRFGVPVVVTDVARPFMHIDVNIMPVPVKIAPVAEAETEIEARPVTDAETDAYPRRSPVPG
jgi:hypothetical protein